MSAPELFDRPRPQNGWRPHHAHTNRHLQNLVVCPLPDGFILLFPPHGKELDFDAGKNARWIIEKGLHHGINNWMDASSGVLDGVIESKVMLLCCSLPANIIMGMRDNACIENRNISD
jgi:hypothetical protein